MDVEIHKLCGCGGDHPDPVAQSVLVIDAVEYAVGTILIDERFPREPHAAVDDLDIAEIRDRRIVIVQLLGRKGRSDAGISADHDDRRKHHRNDAF